MADLQRENATRHNFDWWIILAGGVFGGNK